MSDPVSDPNEAAQDAAWREIVENFGDRVELPELADQPLAQDADVAFDDDVDEAFAPDAYGDAYDADEHDGFVAPRPTLPRTTPERFLAWLGVLGVPIAAVLLFIAHASFHWWIPGWVSTGLALAFLVGFGYLVFAMPREPREPWDDGARL